MTVYNIANYIYLTKRVGTFFMGSIHGSKIVGIKKLHATKISIHVNNFIGNFFKKKKLYLNLSGNFFKSSNA